MVGQRSTKSPRKRKRSPKRRSIENTVAPLHQVQALVTQVLLMKSDKRNANVQKALNPVRVRMGEYILEINIKRGQGVDLITRTDTEMTRENGGIVITAMIAEIEGGMIPVTEEGLEMIQGIAAGKDPHQEIEGEMNPLAIIG